MTAKGVGAVLLGHGDTVMICLSDAASMEDINLTLNSLRHHMPGIKFVLVDSVTGVLVQRKGDGEGEDTSQGDRGQEGQEETQQAADAAQSEGD